jgi:3-oxoacyl-[acyl-carrier protein] reductase
MFVLNFESDVINVPPEALRPVILPTMADKVVVIGTVGGVASALADGLGAALGEPDTLSASDINSVVITVGAEPAPRLQDTAAVSSVEWDVRVGETMWKALVTLQSAHSALARRGGRIVLVVPTVGIAGAAGLVPYTTAVEGIRAMAKSAARQWARDGVVVNLIAAPIRVFAEALSESEGHLTNPAVADDPTLVHSLVETAKFLLRSDVAHVAGATVVVDGGSVMLP